ncbi:MAG: ABC transporter permease [Actinomycetota bacterium]|nr:ABC transporter permease [Actinomycetota bacterium]
MEVTLDAGVPQKPGVLSELMKSFSIAIKDMKIYYFKPAILIFGILFPVAIFFAFTVGRNVDASALFPGLIALTLFFSTTTVGPFSMPWERLNRTFERILFAPVSVSALALGKTISAVVFGLIMSVVPLLLGILFFGSRVSNAWVLFLGIFIGNASIANMGTLISTFGSKQPQNVMLLLNLIRLPMMFMSGIFVPIFELPHWARIVSWFSPVSYATDLIRCGLGFKDYFGPLISSLVLIAFGVLLFLACVLRMTAWNRGD